jgi:hypothetical protein
LRSYSISAEVFGADLKCTKPFTVAVLKVGCTGTTVIGVGVLELMCIFGDLVLVGSGEID